MSGINAEYPDSESPDPLIGVLVRDEPEEEEENEEDNEEEDEDDKKDEDGYSE